MTQEQLLERYGNRVRKADVGLAINKLKVASIKTLKEGLKTGKKSREQIASAQAILMLVKAYEYSNN